MSLRVVSFPGKIASPSPISHLGFMGQYRRHVFVCTSGKTCPTQGSKEVFDLLKKGAAERGLKGIVRVNHSGCMNQCGHGPMVVVYPEDVWYAGVNLENAQQI